MEHDTNQPKTPLAYTRMVSYCKYEYTDLLDMHAFPPKGLTSAGLAASSEHRTKLQCRKKQIDVWVK